MPAGLEARSCWLPSETKRWNQCGIVTTRLASRLRAMAGSIVSPQLATVATMLLMASVLTSNGFRPMVTISGMYSASLDLAGRLMWVGPPRQ